MKDFDYIGDDRYNLFSDPYGWLNDMGLRETLWILDASWIIQAHKLTYHEWLNFDEI